MSNQEKIDWMFSLLSPSEVCRLLDLFKIPWAEEVKSKLKVKITKDGGGGPDSIRVTPQYRARGATVGS